MDLWDSVRHRSEGVLYTISFTNRGCWSLERTGKPSIPPQ